MRYDQNEKAQATEHKLHFFFDGIVANTHLGCCEDDDSVALYAAALLPLVLLVVVASESLLSSLESASELTAESCSSFHSSTPITCSNKRA